MDDRPQRSSAEPTPDSPAVTRPEPLLNTRFLKITSQRANFGDFEKEYHVVDFQPRAGIVIVRDGAVLLVKQWRFLPRAGSWELPGGSIEPDEDPAAGARRECEEESGIVCGDLIPLCRYFPGLDNVDNETHLFACRKVIDERPFRADPAEVVERRWFTFAAVFEKIAEGSILDAMTILGLSYYVVQNPENPG